jgi:phosphoglycolate phosphatase
MSPTLHPVPRCLLLFDLDGTLIDSRRDLVTATNLMRGAHGLPPLDLATVVSYVGDGLAKLAERALQGAPVDPAAAVCEIGDFYADHLVDETRPYPGVPENLKALHAAGHRLGLVTNKPARHARRIFDHFGWTDDFSVLMAGGDTPSLKPSPEPILEAMRRTGASPSETWMVGDHHTDLEAARRAGVSSIFLLSGLGSRGTETPTRIYPDFASFTRAFLP